jgi:hypothetical protein
MTALYVPGVEETDTKKIIRSQQLVASQTSTNTANVATNTANVATNTANIATNTSAITALQAGPLVSGSVAAQSDQETATSTTLAVTPGRQKFHPLHPKALAYVTVAAGTYTLTTNTGVSGIVKNSTGNITLTFSTAFSSANYHCIVSANTNVRNWTVVSRTTNTVNLVTTDDAAGFDLVAFGDLP